MGRQKRKCSAALLMDVARLCRCIRWREIGVTSLDGTFPFWEEQEEMNRLTQYENDLRGFKESVRRAHMLVAKLSDDDKLVLKKQHDAIRSVMLALEQALSGIKN